MLLSKFTNDLNTIIFSEKNVDNRSFLIDNLDYSEVNNLLNINFLSSLCSSMNIVLEYFLKSKLKFVFYSVEEYVLNNVYYVNYILNKSNNSKYIISS